MIVSCRSNNVVVKTGLLKDQSINIAGISRQYHLYLPANPATARVVVLLHGHGGSSDQLMGLTGIKTPYKLWLNVAQRENLILAIPNGSLGSNNKRGWNDCRSDAQGNPSSNDVLFVSELINHISDNYLSKLPKVFAVGTSNGGHMVLRLAQEIPEKLAAIGVIVAANSAQSKCSDSNSPISILIMNGTNDPLLPFEGGQIASNRGEVFSSEATTSYWASRNQTETTPIVTEIPDTDTNDGSSISKYNYQNGINNSEVVLYRVLGGGHTEPSIAERYSNIYKAIVGNQNGDIEMAEEIWAFFNGLVIQ